jgi:hypothetical protein
MKWYAEQNEKRKEKKSAYQDCDPEERNICKELPWFREPRR